MLELDLSSNMPEGGAQEVHPPLPRGKGHPPPVPLLSSRGRRGTPPPAGVLTCNFIAKTELLHTMLQLKSSSNIQCSNSIEL